MPFRSVPSRLIPCLAPILLLIPIAPAAAQEPAPRSAWKRKVELAGSLFLGNKPQSVLTTQLGASHADSTFEFGGSMRFTYATATDEGERYVSQRSWIGSLNLDLWPHAGQSPFLLGTVESSMEKRIDLRASGGVGHKLTFVEDSRATANLSIAVLGERSWLQTKEDGQEIRSLARFSGRLRLRRKLGERMELNQETYFRPEVYNMDHFTFTNSASASYRMNSLVQLKASYLDNYDSGARARGARSNYDAQVVVGIQAEF